MPDLYGFADLRDIQRIDRTVRISEHNRARATPQRLQRVVPPRLPLIGIYNDSGQTIPSFGCVLLKGGKGQKSDTGEGPAQGICASVKRPDTYGCQHNALIVDQAWNGSSYGYADKTFGAAQIQPPFIAAYDSGDGTPAFGDMWGPRSGTFLLKKNTGGFYVIGVYDSAKHYALVVPFPMRRVVVKNLTGSDIAKGATNGTVTIMTGTPGAETSSGITLTNVLSRWGAFKNNAIGHAVVIETTQSATPQWEIDNTDTC